MSILRFKRNDTAAKISSTLSTDTGIFDLSDYTVKLVFKRVGSTAAATKATATIVDAVGGKVEYQFLAAETAVAGLYEYEWEVTHTTSGAILTFPSDERKVFEVVADVG